MFNNESLYSSLCWPKVLGTFRQLEVEGHPGFGGLPVMMTIEARGIMGIGRDGLDMDTFIV